MISSRRLSLVLFSSILAGCGSSAFAQDLPDVAQGFQPYVAYHGGQLDSVNAENGGLTIRIPLVSYPQKGSLSLSYSLIFNSFGFQVNSNCDSAPDPSGPIDAIPLRNGCQNTVALMTTGIPGTFQPGPRIIADQAVFAGGSRAPLPLQTQNPPTEGRFYVITADNAEHPLGLNGYHYRAFDGSGFQFDPSAAPAASNGNFGLLENLYSGDPTILMSTAPGVITDSSGNQYTSSYILDPNGNRIYISNSSFGLDATDSVGRRIYGPVADQNYATDCPTLSNAQNQPVTSATTWTPPGTEKGFLFCYASVNVYTNIFVGSSTYGREFIRTISMLQSITLPNGQFWGFIYDSNPSGNVPSPSNPKPLSTGNLVTLIYPTGGSVNYTYAWGNAFCEGQRAAGTNTGNVFHYPLAVSTRTEVDAHGNVLGTWTYTTVDQTTLKGSIAFSSATTPATFSVTKFENDGHCGYLDAGQDVYNGSSASGTPVQSTNNTYDFPSSDQGKTAGLPETSDGYLQSRTTTMDGVQTYSESKTFAYVTLQTIDCDYLGNNCGAGTSFSEPLGSPTQVTYTGGPGGGTKVENTTYLWQNNSSYLINNLLDRPAQTSVQGLDLNGNLVTQASSSYLYDESGYSPGGTRGLPTSVTQVNNTGTSPTTHTYWNASGEKSAVIDANGKSTSFSYSGDSITTQSGQTTTKSCNGAEVTSTTNALNQTISGLYDCDKGLLTSLTDANGNTTDVDYDAMNRILSITYPSVTVWNGQSIRPQTSFDYRDSQKTVVQTIHANPDPDRTVTVSFDDFGRQIHRVTSSQNGTINVDTTYDGNHNVHSVSNPYVSSSDSSYGLTTYTYDAARRRTGATLPDSHTLRWSYAGRVTDFYDELNRHSQQTSDGLGHLVKVMEPDPASGSPGLETDYTYDALGNLWKVTQWGGASGSSGARVRSFTYDSLSRLLCASNPESATASCPTSATSSYTAGTLGYTYDLNGNVLSKTDARGVTANYSYDALNRIVNRWYSNDSTGTPWTCYQYDTAPNGVGRLASEWTQKSTDGSCSLTSAHLQFARSITGYDAMGHLLGEQVCTPGNCTTATGPVLSYGYDLAGNIGQISDSAAFSGPNALQFSYDAGGHLSTASNGNTAFPSTIYTLQNYGAPGPLNWVLGSNLSFTQNFNSRLWTNSLTVQGQKP